MLFVRHLDSRFRGNDGLLGRWLDPRFRGIDGLLGQAAGFLLAHGQTGLSTDFDHPTLTGYDSDHELAEGEVGHLGVAIDTAADMGELLTGYRWIRPACR